MTETVDTQLKFSGSLTKQDAKTYHPHTFDVPEGVTNIHIDFSFTPLYASGRIHRNQINFSLNDPDGIRGVANIIREEGVDVNGVASSPGFGSWPIQAGTWTAFVDCHRVLSPDTVAYDLTITLSHDALSLTPRTFPTPQPVASAQAGWYRGDLHAHTIHSDGRWDVPEFTQFMRSQGLDFVSLSDHNTVTGLAQHRSQTEDGFLAMGGMELSTFNGHMLALGSSHLYEWRLNIEPGMDVNRIMQQVIDQGDLLIIAHPMAPDDPFCSGCHWFFDEARPGVALGVEVWNGGWHRFNEEGLQQYYTWLNLGHRLVMTSGSDIHGEPNGNRPRRNGSNVVYAEELSERAILDAIRKGHSYLSAGPELLLTAESDSGGRAMCGDQISGQTINVNVAWQQAHPGDVVRLIVDGKTQDEAPIGTSGEMQWSRAAGDIRWFTVEMRDANGEMWAVSNPIYL